VHAASCRVLLSLVHSALVSNRSTDSEYSLHSGGDRRRGQQAAPLSKTDAGSGGWGQQAAPLSKTDAGSGGWGQQAAPLSKTDAGSGGWGQQAAPLSKTEEKLQAEERTTDAQQNSPDILHDELLDKHASMERHRALSSQLSDMTSRAEIAENERNVMRTQLKERSNMVSLMTEVLDDTTRRLDFAASRAKAAEQQVQQLKAQLHVVEVFDVDKDQAEQVVRGDVEPAAKRLKRLQEGANKLHAQVVKAQVHVKQEKTAIAEDLEDTQDNYQLQITFTDTLQTKLEEMAKLALKNGAELCEVNEIKRQI
jgi:chromosome segregation ATPase